jgi:hypothetical protein
MYNVKLFYFSSVAKSHTFRRRSRNSSRLFFSRAVSGHLAKQQQQQQHYQCITPIKKSSAKSQSALFCLRHVSTSKFHLKHFPKIPRTAYPPISALMVSEDSYGSNHACQFTSPVLVPWYLHMSICWRRRRPFTKS